MPNIDTLIHSFSQRIINYQTESHEKLFCSTIDLKYAFSQLNISLDTAKHCKFDIVSYDMTGI